MKNQVSTIALNPISCTYLKTYFSFNANHTKNVVDIAIFFILLLYFAPIIPYWLVLPHNLYQPIIALGKRHISYN